MPLQSKKPPVDLDLLTSLAKRFADRGMLEEAAELFQLALRFEPANLGIKLNLAQLRHQLKKTRNADSGDGEEAIRERLRRDTIDGYHFFGLAALYDERGKPEQADECLDFARRKDAVNPYVHKLAGKLLNRRQRFDDAAAELMLARRFNPFDRETAELFGRVEYEREHYRAALEATIDAFLLIPDDDRGGANRLKKRIRTLKSIRGMSSQELVELFHEQRDKLQTAFDRLEWHRERILSDAEPELGEIDKAPPTPRIERGRLELAQRLRRLDSGIGFSDEQVFTLTRAAIEEIYADGSTIFEYGSDGRDIFILTKGRIAIRRPTSYGTFELGTLRPESVFGEANFISRYQRSGDAVAVGECHVVRLDAEHLELVIGDAPDLGLQLYSTLWHGLAQKLRAANEQLRTFFSTDAPTEQLLEMRRGNAAEAGAVDVRSDDKIQLLREQGLTGSELTTLANFSDVKRFDADTFLFHEGDAGEEMYVVLEGQVMISKYIPGGGEEALAILDRGDFFGEMALVDGEPRSADAKAFGQPVTVVAFDQETLGEVMAMDPHAALEFMALLCRLICKRLREIDEKVTGWRIMSGSRPDEQGDDTAVISLPAAST